MKNLEFLYNNINFIFCKEMKSLNNPINRKIIKDLLKNETKDFNCLIKCDEENNSPFILNNDCLVARIYIKEGLSFNYIDLIFGDNVNLVDINQQFSYF